MLRIGRHRYRELRAGFFTLVFTVSNQATFANQSLQEIKEQPTQIAPEKDPLNSLVASTAIFAMLIKFEIRGDVVTRTEVKLTKLPVSVSSFSRDPSGIVIEVYNSDRESVGCTSVADRRMFARDGETVIVTDRTVSALVPVFGTPDRIKVAIPGAASSQTVTVTQQIEAQCRDSSLEYICSNQSPEPSFISECLQANE